MGFPAWLLRGLILPVAVGGLVAYYLLRPSPSPAKKRRSKAATRASRARRGPRPSRKSPARHGRKRAKATVRATHR